MLTEKQPGELVDDARVMFDNFLVTDDNTNTVSARRPLLLMDQ